MKRGVVLVQWCVLSLQLGLLSCAGERVTPNTLREYLREVVTEALDKHFAELKQRLDRLEKTIQRYGEGGGSCGVQQKLGAAPDRVVVCNVASWAYYRPGNGKFTVDNVNPQLCTHIVYQFAGLDEVNHKLRSLNPTLDLGTSETVAEGGNFGRFVQLKNANPKLKVLLSVGGFLEGSIKYSRMAREPAGRATFVSSAVELLERHGFDGLDMSWHHPTRRGGVPEDRRNFILLLQELRAAFQPRGWLLTASLSPLMSVVEVSYDVPQLTAVLDLLLLQGYDYHGVWDRQTGHNAPLDRVTDSVRNYLRLGAEPAKLVLGIPFSGSTFVLSDPTNSGVGAPSAESAFQSPYTQLDGSIGYNEVCEMTANGSWTMHWDETAQVPYYVQGSRWVSAENERSVVRKVALVKQFRLEGVMVNSLDTDDFRGVCGEKNGLLKVVIQALRK